jgi:hypothetical protein
MKRQFSLLAIALGCLAVFASTLGDWVYHRGELLRGAVELICGLGSLSGITSIFSVILLGILWILNKLNRRVGMFMLVAVFVAMIPWLAELFSGLTTEGTEFFWNFWLAGLGFVLWLMGALRVAREVADPERP